MKILLKISLALLILLFALFFILKLTGNSYLLKGLRSTYLQGASSATIDDARFFNTHPISTGNETWEWHIHPDYNKTALTPRLNEVLTENKSVAFLVIRNDSILSEYYWDGYSDSSRSNSFSMAKSITTLLAQIAIQKGVFESWNQKVISILPELKGDYAGELELWHLSTMSSGLQWEEHYKNPFAVTAKAYYGDDVWELMLSLPIESQPGVACNYQSGSTQLLGIALIKATGKTLSELASEWLWNPMQTNHDATWHTDDKGTELAYCCFNSNARDFARFGKLMLNFGNWNGTQVLDSAFVRKATTGALGAHYGYSFWLMPDYALPVFYQKGILGQYIISIPEYNMIIVRLGHQRQPNRDAYHPEDLYVLLEETLKMMKFL